MTDNTELTPRKALWEDIVVIAAGVWLLVSPAVLRLLAVDAYASVGLGIVFIALGFASMRKDRLWVEGVIIILGLALAALPWLPGEATTGDINAAISGVVAMVAASWRAHDIRARRLAGETSPPPIERNTSDSDDERRVA